ncbi:MAG: EF-P lysine aminoacylase GenX [Desulfobulbaceae bacterium]|jgi:lysyl-tRNA synthetase class 2|nr:EF-P lysine aminoacylase GenX [Desulfobulbaceae bacterium]
MPDAPHTRAACFSCLRAFFAAKGFLEVDTPIRLPAIIPERFIEPITSEDFFLQTSPELCMKRLLARGYPRIFQISHCFRRGEKGRLHHEEFMMLEWYRLGADYRRLMADCDALLAFLAQNLDKFLPPDTDFIWPARLREEFLLGAETVSVADAFARHAPRSLDEAMAAGAFDELLVHHVEPHLGRSRPTFLTDYPAELASLARLSPEDERIAERFELYSRGIELANGFSELTDANEQRRRFAEEIATIARDGKTRPAMPERFLADLARIDAASGIALGLDRLIMLLLDESALATAVTFAPDDL